MYSNSKAGRKYGKGHLHQNMRTTEREPFLGPRLRNTKSRLALQKSFLVFLQA
jgi:hypothetical protein